MFKRFLTLLRWHRLALAVLIGSCIVVLNRPCEYKRVKSPDGQYVCVAYFPLWQSLIPMSPGSSGDKSGYVEMFATNGKSLGSAPIEMVSMISDLRWDLNEARIIGLHTWSLPDGFSPIGSHPQP